MGEAGAEAVMPLTRGPDGSLGVQMYSQGGSAQAAQSPQPIVLDLRVHAEEGDMFRPTVEAIAENKSVTIMQQGMNEMNSQLPDRVEQIVNDPRLKG